MKPAEKKLAIFDFDGVISDSFEYCLKINQKMQPHMTADDYRELFEGNFYESLCKFADKETIGPEYQSTYWNHFVERMDDIFLVDGIKDVLHKLSSLYNLVIVSSSDSEIIKTILKREHLEPLFGKIYGSDAHQSKHKKFQMIFEEFGASPCDCIFVTDTLGDLIEAETADIESIAVSWGFHDAKTLERGKYKSMIHKPDELIQEINNHFDKE